MIITNAKVLMGDKFATGVDVKITGDRIVEIGEHLSGWTLRAACWHPASATYTSTATADTTPWTAKKACSA